MDDSDYRPEKMLGIVILTMMLAIGIALTVAGYGYSGHWWGEQAWRKWTDGVPSASQACTLHE